MDSITNIRLDDWKNETSETTVAPLTALRGPSGSGKTGRLMAAMYAFMGHCGDGKRNEDMADYAGPGGTSVGISLESGFSFDRGIKATEGGGWAEFINIAGAKRTGVERARSELHARFGDFSVALNPEEIIAMKPEASRDFILDLCQSSNEYDADTIARLVLLELLYQHSSCGESTAKMYLEMGCNVSPETCSIQHIYDLSERQLSAREYGAVKSIGAKLVAALSAQGDGANERISAALDAIEEFVKIAKAEERKGREGGELIASRKNSAPIVAGDMGKLKAEAAELRVKEVELEKRITAQQGADQHADTHRTRLDQIEIELTQADAEANKEFTPIVDVESAKTEREQLAAQADQYVGEANELDANVTRIEGLRSDAATARHELEIKAVNRNGVQDQIAKLEPEVNQDTVDWLADSDRRSADALESASRAAFTHAPGTDDLIAVRDRIKGEIATATEQQRRLDIRRNEAHAALTASDRALAASTVQMNELAASPAMVMHSHLCDTCKEHTASIIKDQQDRLETIEATNARLTESVNADRETLSGIEAELAAIHDKIAGLEVDKATAQESIDKASKDRENALGEANTLSRRAELRRAADARAAQLSELREKLAAFPADLDQQITEIGNKVGGYDAEIQTAKEQVKAFRAEIESIKSRIADLTQAIDKEQSDEASFAQRKADAAARVARLTTEKTDTQAKLDNVIADSPNLSIESMETELANVREQIKVADDRITKKQNYDNLQREYAEVMANAEAKQTEHEIGTMAVAAIKNVREFLMVELTRPVTEKMTEFLEQYESGLSAFITLSKSSGKAGAVFKLGWIKDGRRVTSKVLAGGEKPVLIAALAYAVTLLKAPPLKLMLVDACAATPDVLAKLIKALEWASPQFGNILMAVHPTCPVGAFSDNWLVTDITRTPQSTQSESNMAASAA